MPYVTQDRKDALAGGEAPQTVGDLTYLYTVAIIGSPREATLDEALEAATDSWLREHGVSYATLNGVVGSLACAGMEHLRRTSGAGPAEARADATADFAADFYANVVAPYEDTKIKQNGDVYQ